MIYNIKIYKVYPLINIYTRLSRPTRERAATTTAAAALTFHTPRRRRHRRVWPEPLHRIIRSAMRALLMRGDLPFPVYIYIILCPIHDARAAICAPDNVNNARGTYV